MATNNLGLYDPLFYAQEALIQLEKAMGMARYVHRGYEKNPQEAGSQIRIRRPTSFTAANMPVAPTPTAPEEVTINLNQWQGVTIRLTDRELSYTTERIIEEHIRPAAVAVADAIDLSLADLARLVPWFVEAQNPGTEADFTNVREVMFNNRVPSQGLRFAMLNGERENDYLQRQVFMAADSSSEGARTQSEGYLGRRFGYDTFANQNVQVHTPGTLNVTTGTLQTSGTQALGASQVVLAATAVTGTINRGDTFVIAGNTQRYTATANATAAGNAITVQISPPLVQQYATAQAVTLRQQANRALNVFAHQHAFALAMAPLSDLGGQLGARISTVVDPITGLALRSRMWYDGDNARVNVGIDALWGVTVLNPNLAVRLESPTV